MRRDTNGPCAYMLIAHWAMRGTARPRRPLFERFRFLTMFF